MFQTPLLLIILLLGVVSILSMLAERLKVAYPIFLVISGLALGFVPNIPKVELDPDLVFIIFLPPLLFFGAWNMSWKNFWIFRRSISLLALGLVIFTSTSVAYFVFWLVPGFTLALGFLLGGIISPPDPIAASSVFQRIKIPKGILIILEGEGLVNDAVSLIVFRFALVAVLTNKFVLWEASLDFFFVVVAGILTGLVISLLIYCFHRFLPTTPSIDTALTFISPYLMYMGAEHFHFSGVLSVVAGGLFLSSRSSEVFTFGTRIQSHGVWETMVFLMNGVIFILIGLQLPEILKGMETESLWLTVFYGVAISLLTVVLRLVWVFPAAYLPRILSKKLREKEPDPGWKSTFIIAWSGMRGVVSLAAALSIPLTMGMEPFPHRNQILLITYIVIFCTLVLQGLSLPFLIRKLNIEDKNQERLLELDIQINLISAVLNHIKLNYAKEIEENMNIEFLLKHYENQLLANQKQIKRKSNVSKIYPYQTLLLELVEVKRKCLESLQLNSQYPQEMLRSFEKELDHEEARLNEQDRAS